MLLINFNELPVVVYLLMVKNIVFAIKFSAMARGSVAYWP
jgi:hypothetical protein